MNLTIKIHLSVEGAEADGTNCKGCEDPVFFNASCIRMTIDGDLKGGTPLDGQFCASCAEILKDGLS